MKINFTFYVCLLIGLFTNFLSAKSHTTLLYNFNAGTLWIQSPANNMTANGRFIPLNPGVEYLSFDAILTDKYVDLKWVTGSESNHSHFELERSFDRVNYKTIAVVLNGFENAENNKVYRFKDNSKDIKGKQVIYYRLKQFNQDGKFNYSDIDVTVTTIR